MRVLRPVIATLFLCVLFATSLQAQVQSLVTVRTKSFSFANQLPSNEIYKLYQDHDGFLWLGTTGGVARWDGYQLRVFANNVQHPTMLADNRITDIAEDDRFVWIANRRGINLWDKQLMRLSPLADTLTAGQNVQYLVWADSMVWAATSRRLFRSRRGDAPLEELDGSRLPLGDLRITALKRDAGGHLWLAMGHQLVTYDSARDCFIVRARLPEGTVINDIFEDRNRQFWIGTTGGGLFRMVMGAADSLGTVIHHPIISPLLHQPERGILSICQDNVRGWLWLISFNSLYAFDFDYHRQELVPVDLNHGVPTERSYIMGLVDHESNLWLSSHDHGSIVSFVDETMDNKLIKQASLAQGFSPNLVALGLDSDGTLWWLQENYGLCARRSGDGRVFFATGAAQEATLDARKITFSRTHQGVWIIGPRRREICHFVLRDGQIVQDKSIQTDEMFGWKHRAELILEKPGGLFWVGGKNDVALLNAQGDFVDQIPFSATAICGGEAGVAYVADRTGRVLRLELKGNKLNIGREFSISLVEDEFITNLAVDAGGRLWTCTNLQRFGSFDEQSGDFIDKTWLLNLGGTTILHMMADNRAVWITTHNKALRINTANESVTEFLISDGNMGVELLRQRAACTDGALTVYLGGQGDITSITFPAVERPRSIPHAPSLTDIKIDAKSIFFADSLFQHSSTNSDGFIEAGYPPTLHVKGNYSRISVYFSSLGFVTASPVLYSYRIPEQDTTWVLCPMDVHYAIFRSLPKAPCTLQVRASYDGVHWTPPTNVLRMNVKAGWWLSGWAIAVYVLLALLLVAGLFFLHYRLRRAAPVIPSAIIVQMEGNQSPVPAATPEEQFIREMADIIRAHIADDTFGLSDLADMLCISKSSLHRKVKQITGRTPLDVIRSVRLQYAKGLLANQKMSVSDVAYASGFTSPKYFSKCFKEEFQLTPKAYVESLDTPH